MPFYLLILLTGTIFIRPSEWYAPVYAWPIYQCTIIACIVIAFPSLLQQLTTESIRANPITACILAVLAAVALSDAVNPNLTDTTTFSYEFAKIVVYYLLFLGIVDSGEKLDRFLWWLAVIIWVTAIISLLGYYGLIDSSASNSVRKQVDDLMGVDRVGTPGKNADANDFAVFLVAGIVICVICSSYLDTESCDCFGWRRS